MRYFCPACWRHFAEDFDRCPACGLAARGLWDSKDYVDKLIAALRHPVQSTAIRAAWILGQKRQARAVRALIELVGRAPDVYIATAGVEALGAIGTPEALTFLEALVHHPAQMVRAVARRTLEDSHAQEEH